MKRWMIIGGGGVFGIHLARHLLAAGVERVVGVGRNPLPAPEFTLRTGEGDPRFAFHQVHMTHEPERLLRLAMREQPDVVVNFAALAAWLSWEDSWRYYDTNVVALARFAEGLMGQPWLKRFIQVGTSELYGSVTAPADETAPLRPTSPYAVSKMAADLHMLSLASRGFPAMVIRPSNCYGEGQLFYRILPRAAWCARAGVRLPLEGGGTARKSYMHADDLARAIVLMARDGEVGKVYNAGPSDPVSIRDLVGIVARCTGVAFEDLVQEAPARRGEDACYWLASGEIAKLGWSPRIHLEDGVQRVVDWVTACFDRLPPPQPFVLRS